jgi:nucleoside-diphosphate-sugar epimerase
MKYILIEGSGFIGQHFFKRLEKKIVPNIDIDSGINNIEYEFCDILNYSDLESINLSTWSKLTLIHLAAVHFDFQTTFYETNVTGASNVLKFLSNHDNIKKYVFFSSVASYGDYENFVARSIQSVLNQTYDQWGV